jgi:hypothetical protein
MGTGRLLADTRGVCDGTDERPQHLDSRAVKITHFYRLHRRYILRRRCFPRMSETKDA